MNYELYTTKHWMILPSFVHGILPTLMYNTNNHIAIGVVEKKQPYLVASGSGEVIRDSQVTEDGTVVPRYDWDGNLLANMREPFVNVIPIDGPITRNGDACSYGSKEIRDWMMEAADNKFCRAHVLVVNTPGGSAWAKNDFQQAIDFAHESGQRVYMLVDGLCASAGMYLASFCDEVYVVNLKDQLGCVGVMASFFTIKNGEKNQFDSETYHEYYDPESVDKNKEYRDIAENDDATLLIEELRKLGEEFRAYMKASFPNADVDEHLKGKIFDASDVMGILCDGQMLLGELVGRAFAVANGSEEPIARTAGRVIVAPEETPDDEPDGEPSGTVARTDASKNNVSPKNSTTMKKEKYQKLAQLLGVDELVVTEEGTFLNALLLDKLTEKLDEMEKKAAEDEAAQAAAQEESEHPAVPAEPESAEQPTEEQPEAPAEDPAEEEPAAAPEAPAAEEQPASAEAVADAQAEIDRIADTLRHAESMIEQKDKEIAERDALIAAKDFDLETANSAASSAIAQRDDVRAELEQAKAQIGTLQAQLEEAQNALTEARATIEAKEAEINEMAAGADEQPAAEIPDSNAQGAEVNTNKHSAYRRGMSYKEYLRTAKDEKSTSTPRP